MKAAITDSNLREIHDVLKTFAETHKKTYKFLGEFGTDEILPGHETPTDEVLENIRWVVDNSERLSVDRLDFKTTGWFKDIHNKHVAWEKAKYDHAGILHQLKKNERNLDSLTSNFETQRKDVEKTIRTITGKYMA